MTAKGRRFGASVAVETDGSATGVARCAPDDEVSGQQTTVALAVHAYAVTDDGAGEIRVHEL